MPNLDYANFNTVQAAVVQTLDNAIHRINRYPKDHSKGNQLRYPVDRDLSGGYRYPPFEQLGPGSQNKIRELQMKISQQNYSIRIK